VQSGNDDGDAMTQKVDQAIARSVELGGTVVMIPHATKEDLDYARSIRIDGTMAGYSAQDRGVSTHWGRSNGSVWFIGLVVRDPQELLAQVESITRERDHATCRPEEGRGREKRPAICPVRSGSRREAERRNDRSARWSDRAAN